MSARDIDPDPKVSAQSEVMLWWMWIVVVRGGLRRGSGMFGEVAVSDLYRVRVGWGIRMPMMMPSLEFGVLVGCIRLVVDGKMEWI